MKDAGGLSKDRQRDVDDDDNDDYDDDDIAAVYLITLQSYQVLKSFAITAFCA
jgi:hypothetical protein